MKKCTKCGFLTDDSNSFCPKCGNILQSVETEQSQWKKDRSKFRKKEAGIVIGLIAFIVAIPLFVNSISRAPSNNPSNGNSTTEISEEDYRSACQPFDYKELCRYPDKHKGEFVKVEVRVSQILKDGETYWQGYTDEDGFGYYDNEYVLIDRRGRDAVRVLEEDILVVYGQYRGLVTMERALGSVKVELPCIEVEYIDILD